MASHTYKLYHVHGIDSRQFLEHYLSQKGEAAYEEDSLKFPIENLTNVFTEGLIKGDILIDLSLGPLVHLLYAASEFFKHIIVLKTSDRCIMELKRWLDSRTGAFNWEHATKYHIETKGNSDRLQEKEENLKSVVQHVVKCDLEKENMTDPIVLPPADCIISAWLLGGISKDQDDYIRYLKKISGLLKPGGHLILIEALETTYFTVGKDRIYHLTFKEDFVRKALVGESFIIDYCKVKVKTFQSDFTDYKGIIFIAAHREVGLRSGAHLQLL